MGKGRILENLGEGLYTLDVIYNTEKFDKFIQGLRDELLILQVETIPNLKIVRDTQLAAKNAAELNLDLSIINLNLYSPNSSGYAAAFDDVNNKTKVRNVETWTLQTLETELIGLNTKEIGLTVEINYLLSKRVEKKTVSAWSLDYNVDYVVGQEIGTIEIPGEIKGREVWIKPGGLLGDKSVYNAKEDGQMTQGWGLHSSEVFYALAMTPGWQRWRPQFRIGTIIFVDIINDKVQVSFDQAENTNKEGFYGIPEGSSTLVDVSCDYMEVGASVFLFGEKVIVKFDKATDDDIKNLKYTGQVVGFYSNPKAVSIRLKLTEWLPGTFYNESHLKLMVINIFDSKKYNVTHKFTKRFINNVNGESYFEVSLDKQYLSIEESLKATRDKDYFNPHLDPKGYWIEYSYGYKYFNSFDDGINDPSHPMYPYKWYTPSYGTPTVGSSYPIHYREGVSLLTQYPFVYAMRQTDRRKQEHLVKLGSTISDTIHYANFVEYGYREKYDNGSAKFGGLTPKLGEPWVSSANTNPCGGAAVNDAKYIEYSPSDIDIDAFFDSEITISLFVACSTNYMLKWRAGIHVATYEGYDPGPPLRLDINEDPIGPGPPVGTVQASRSASATQVVDGASLAVSSGDEHEKTKSPTGQNGITYSGNINVTYAGSVTAQESYATNGHDCYYHDICDDGIYSIELSICALRTYMNGTQSAYVNGIGFKIDDGV